MTKQTRVWYVITDISKIRLHISLPVTLCPDIGMIKIQLLITPVWCWCCLYLQSQHCAKHSSHFIVTLGCCYGHLYTSAYLLSQHCDVGIFISHLKDRDAYLCHNIVVLVCFYSYLKFMTAYLFSHNIVMLICYYIHLTSLQS